MKAVWLVRVRELAGRMRFWIAIVGYDPRKRSLSQSIYLIYVAIFFSLWGFAVLALLANLGAGMLTLVNGATPSETSTMIVAIVLFGDAVLQGYKAGRRSPFIFSETDAELICQTPLDRKQVALAWFLGDWLPDGLVFGALAVILRFASLQLVEPGGVVWAHLPGYLLAGLQVASIILPLHMALMAIDYALGAWRLRGDRDNPWLRWIPVGAGVVLITLAIVNTRGIQIILWPLLFPLSVGFGEGYWLVGFTFAVLLVMTGLLVLYQASPRLNLSRAAQESRFRWAFQQISWLGDSRLRGEMITRQKLGVSHQSSRIQGRAGVWVLIWKDWVATVRTMNFGTVMGWLGIFVVFTGVLLVPDWGARMWAFAIWSLLVGQRCTKRLRADLRVWTITRQLPFSWRKTLVAELATPVVGAALVSWLAMGVSTWLGFTPQTSLILLAPAPILCITLTAAFDILRNCRSSELLVGHVADLGAGGLISGIILAAIPMVMVSWSASQSGAQGINWLITLLGISLSIGIIYGMWRLAAAALKNIK
jgi:hypothetical protein